jgi:predicted membrane-bound mannosyltransferase
MLMLTSFLQDFTGLQDSIAAIQVNWDKSGEHSVHAHPWYQYVKWLAFSSAGTYFYSESLIAILAITGIFYSFKRTYDTSDKSLFFMKFMSLFAIISTFIFSVILYKTPWNALSFWLAMVILAGFGLHSVLQDIHNKKYRNILIIIVLITVVQLGWQSYQVNFIDYENPANPYVYAHPQKDIFRILDPLNKIASKHADKNDLYIQVIVKDNDYWPLPWYLRHFTKVGWWNRVDMDVTSADFIIISPEMEGDLVYKFYEETEPGKRNLYVPLLPDNITLRSGTQLKVFVTLKIRDLLNDD